MFRTQDTGAKNGGRSCVLPAVSWSRSEPASRQNAAGALPSRNRPQRCDGRVENDPAVVDLVLEVELTGLLFGDNVIGGTSTRRTPVATGILWREGSLHDGR